ncbi:MAG: hypothetical protein QXS20_09850 [Candidatus Thorarchaeota archaeon]
MKRYVSRGDIRDSIDIDGPHRDADMAIYRLIRLTRSDHAARFQPILGSAGMGKTHLYWVLKDHESDEKVGPYSTVYVPSPPSPIRVPLHFHACLADELGDDLFSKAAASLVSRYSRDIGPMDLARVVQRAVSDHAGVASDAVKVLLIYHLDEGRRVLARRWLLGDSLSQEELDELDVRMILEDDDVTLAAIRILTHGYDRPIVLFIDEMEGPFNTHGEVGERQFLEVLKRMYNECRNIVIVASCLTEIWPRIFQMADAPMRSRMEPPIPLRPFTRDDVRSFVEKSMMLYWTEQNMESPPDTIFPLTPDDIDEAFRHSKGVPREAIRHIIHALDTILIGRLTTAVAPQDDHVIKLTSSVVIGAVVKGILIVGIKMGAQVRLKTASGGGAKQASAIVTVTRNSTKRDVIVDVPTVKDWDRSGGVAAFYSAQRVKLAIEEGQAEMGVVAIPEATKGAKFDSLSAELGRKMFVIRLSSSDAVRLVESTNRATLEEQFKGPFMDLIGSLFAV